MLAWARLEDVLHVHRWRQLTAPIAAARVSYGLALGNHDAEADLMRVEIVSLDMQVTFALPLAVLLLCPSAAHPLPFASSANGHSSVKSCLPSWWGKYF